MRRALLTVFAVLVVGVIVLVVLAARTRTDVAQTLGVAPAGPAAPLAHGQTVCQSPIFVSDTFERVRFFPSTPDGSSPPIRVQILDAATKRVLGAGALAAGSRTNVAQTVPIGSVTPQRRVSLCFTDRGAKPVAILGDEIYGTFCQPTGAVVGPFPIGCAYGWVRPTISTSAASIDGQTPIAADVAADLLRDHPQSLLDRGTELIRRATVFKPAFAGTWLYWLLLAIVLTALPALLAYSLRQAELER